MWGGGVVHRLHFIRNICIYLFLMLCTCTVWDHEQATLYEPVCGGGGGVVHMLHFSRNRCIYLFLMLCTCTVWDHEQATLYEPVCGGGGVRAQATFYQKHMYLSISDVMYLYCVGSCTGYTLWACMWGGGGRGVVHRLHFIRNRCIHLFLMLCTCTVWDHGQVTLYEPVLYGIMNRLHCMSLYCVGMNRLQFMSPYMWDRKQAMRYEPVNVGLWSGINTISYQLIGIMIISLPTVIWFIHISHVHVVYNVKIDVHVSHLICYDLLCIGHKSHYIM